MSATINCARIRDDLGYKNELRLRAQTNLFWLAHELLGYSLLSEAYHREVAEHYIQKDPRKSIQEQDVIKNRLHLAPRGSYKSTMNMSDTVQWIIGFPDCAILLLSAGTKLTQGFAGEVSGHFVLPKGATPTAFQELFPEFCILPSAQLTGSYSAPCGAPRKESTLMSSSIDSSLSGWHFDVVKEDDIVDNRNSETPMSIAKVKKNRHINRKMLMPWGYRDTAGTRYDPFDAYGEDLAKGKLKVLVRAALKILEGSEYAQEYGPRLSPMRFPEPDECVLVFPELLSYEFLREDFEGDYSAFMTQYMNDPHGGRDIVFRDAALQEAVLPEECMPVQGRAIIAWRLSCASKPGMKYAAAAVGRVDNGKVFIFDSMRGIYPPTALAQRVVSLAKKHGARETRIEDTPGAHYLQRHIENAMVEQSWEVSIAWADFETDDGARDLRLKSCEPLLSGRRLYFSAALPHLRDVFHQFGNYGMVEENELVDVVARVSEAMPGSIELRDSQQHEDAELEAMIARDRHDRVYGLGHGPQSIEDEAVEVEEQAWEAEGAVYGLNEIAPGLGV